jgi:hypothetical protein
MKLELSLNEKLAAKNQHLQELKDKLKKKVEILSPQLFSL